MRAVDDGVEATRGAVGAGRSGAIAGVTRCVKKGSPAACPIVVDGEFQRAHPRVDVDATAGDGVEVVVAQRLVESVADVDAPDVAVAGPSQIIGTNVVRMGRAIHDRSDGRWTNEESVVVVVKAGVVAVVVETELGGVALGEKILYVQIGDVDLLSALVECVQAAIGIFFEQVEPRDVISETVGAKVPKDADAGLFFGENKSPKVAGELLDSSTHRDEVIVRAEVVNFGFDKGFLQSDVRVEAIRAFARVDVHDVAFAGLQEVEIDLRRDTDAKIHRTKTGVAAEEVERQP